MSASIKIVKNNTALGLTIPTRDGLALIKMEFAEERPATN
jgi:hypothetical protein